MHRAGQTLRSAWAASVGLLLVSCSRPARERPLIDAGTTATTLHDSGSVGATADADEAPDADVGKMQFNLGPLPPDAPFEGMMVVEARLTTQPAQIYVFTVKGKKARWDLFGEGGKGAVSAFRVYDGATHKFYTTAPTLKSILVTDEASIAPDAGAADGGYRWSTFAAGPTGVVAGVSCDRQETRDDAFDYVVCSAPGLVPFPMQLLAGAIGQVTPFNGSLMAKGRVPLHVTKRKSHAVGVKAMVGWLEVKQIERGRVPEGAFDLPKLPEVPAANLDYGRPIKR